LHQDKQNAIAGKATGAAALAAGPEVPLWYPGRPTGICTSRGHTCSSLIVNKPFHVTNFDQCRGTLGKTVRDRFGRPLIIRYAYKKVVYVANREQVCSLKGHVFAVNRTLIAENIDDQIWKNLTLWSREDEQKWILPEQKDQYIKCHRLFASFHCSSMFPNCTAEYLDQKPAPPCRELCEEMNEECTWNADNFFLPYKPSCKNYPSVKDPYKRCTRLEVEPVYMARVSAASFTTNFGAVAMLATAAAAWGSAGS